MRGNYWLEYLPSLENNPNLKSLDIEYCGLRELPKDLCVTCPRLSIL